MRVYQKEKTQYMTNQEEKTQQTPKSGSSHNKRIKATCQMYALRTYINHILRQQFECRELCASQISISASFKSCARNLDVGPVYASLIKKLRKTVWASLYTHYL